MGYVICSIVSASIGYMIACMTRTKNRTDKGESCSNESVRAYLLKRKAEEIRKGLGQ